MRFKTFLVTLKNEWIADDVSDAAGGLAFFGILALFPFLIFLVALGALLADPAMIESLVRELGRVAPPDVTTLLGDQLYSLVRDRNTGLATLSGAGAVWVASSGIAALQRTLNKVHDIEERRPIWKTRGISLMVTFACAGMAILAGALAVGVPLLGQAIGGAASSIVPWLALPLAAAVLLLALAVIYWALPNVRRRFRYITPGAVLAVLVWTAASWGFTIYVENFNKFQVMYGALGSIVVLLLWMWISSMAVLLGAEVNSILDRERARLQEPPNDRTS